MSKEEKIIGYILGMDMKTILEVCYNEKTNETNCYLPKSNKDVCDFISHQKNEIKKLKAENERLKKHETIYYINQLQASDEAIKEFRNSQFSPYATILELNEKLKEKDEEIERLKFFKTRYYEMLADDQSIIKQICEKIRKYLKLKETRWYSGGQVKGSTIPTDGLQIFLNQIEKGESGD